MIEQVGMHLGYESTTVPDDVVLSEMVMSECENQCPSHSQSLWKGKIPFALRFAITTLPFW